MTDGLIYRKILETMVELDPRDILPSREQRLQQAMRLLKPELDEDNEY